MTERARQLRDRLSPIQQAQGYLFSDDEELVLELLEALLVNKDRYGYMGCPCRLAAEDRTVDRDIICPCRYRADDVRDFGSCYCNLYVSAEWLDGKIERQYVPERRTPNWD